MSCSFTIWHGRSMTTKLLIVRPHVHSIRERVLKFLTSVGVDTRDPVVLPAGTPNKVVIDTIAAGSFGALLIPMHAHRSEQGDLLDGLSLARRIDAEAVQEGVPIFMPATAFGTSTLELALARGPESGGLSEHLRARLIPLPLDHLQERALVLDVAARLRALTG